MSNLLKEKVLELAKQEGISIRALEKACGLGNGTIKEWDTRSPSVDKVDKIAEHFGVTVDYLIGNENNDDELMELRERLRRNPETKMLFNATMNCTKEQIESVVKMLEAWKS